MPAQPKLTDADVKRIRKRILAGARIRDLAQEFDVNPKTISRRLVALESTEADCDRRRAAKRPEGQVARERRKLADREHEAGAPRNSTSSPRGEDQQPRGKAGHDQMIDPLLGWLNTRKNLAGTARAEASGIVRLVNADGTQRRWFERSEVDSRFEAGWTLCEHSGTGDS